MKTKPQSQAEYTFTEGPLNILMSCRIRLTEEKRERLKSAWRAYRDSYVPEEATHLPGSTVRTSTAFKVKTMPGVSDIIISDICSTRDTISLLVICNLQEALGIELITHEEILEATKSYCEYVWSVAREKSKGN